jgi:hypothetical protein
VGFKVVCGFCGRFVKPFFNILSARQLSKLIDHVIRKSLKKLKEEDKVLWIDNAGRVVLNTMKK